MIKVTELSENEIEEIGEAFADYNYADGEKGIEPLIGRIPMRSQRFLLSICCPLLQRGCPFPSEFACLE